MGILYPRRCAVCGEIISSQDRYSCIGCKEKLQVIREPKCKKCGKSVENSWIEYCFDCSKKQLHFKQGVALWNYNKIMKKSIADFKYHNRREYGRFYAEQILAEYDKTIAEWEIDVLVPIPIHASKKRQRGYNQAEIIALELGKQLFISVEHSLLLRNKKTLPQKGLNDRERLKNLEHAFAVNQKKIGEYIGKRVLLIDDIYTTGSTIETCGKILKEYGMKEVYFITVCIGKGY